MRRTFVLESTFNPSNAVSTSERDRTFEIAFHRHYSRIRRVAARLVASDSEGEELAQEAFLRLHRAPVLERADAEVGAWLLRVVTNLAMNAMRGRRRELGRLERLGRLELAEAAARAVDEEPGKISEREEDQRRVRQVLACLPPRARVCLVLRHSGFSYAEIADAVGIAPGSVGTTLARAERAFREHWEREEWGRNEV